MVKVVVDGKRCSGCRDDIDGVAFEDVDGCLYCGECHAAFDDDARLVLDVENARPPAPIARVCGAVVEALTFARLVGEAPTYRIGRALTMAGWSSDDLRTAIDALPDSPDAHDTIDLVYTALAFVPDDAGVVA